MQQEDICLRKFVSSNDLVYTIVRNTKMRVVLDCVFDHLSNEPESVIVLKSDSQGVQKLVSITELLKERIKNNSVVIKEVESNVKSTEYTQLNYINDSHLWIYLDFSHKGKNEYDEMLQSGWFYN
ncbi:hypothetical protein DAMA08_021260 [Martiniozyma asiatica (nom. inval.)]|nr:hypothetical protein DAMA08_021260 [Martiniozyma asiatica]